MSRNNEFNQGAGGSSARIVPVSPDLDNGGQGYPADQTASNPLGLNIQPTQTNSDDAFQQAVSQTLGQMGGNPPREPLRSQGPVSRSSEFNTGAGRAYRNIRGGAAQEPLRNWERELLGLAADGSEDHLYNPNAPANLSGRPSPEPSGDYSDYDDDSPIEVIQAQAGDAINLDDEEVDESPYVQPDGSVRHPNSSIFNSSDVFIKEPQRQNFRTDNDHDRALNQFKRLKEYATTLDAEYASLTPNSTAGANAKDFMNYWANEFSGTSGFNSNDLRQMKIRKLNLPGDEAEYGSTEDFVKASMDYRAAERGDEDALSRFTIGSDGYANHHLSITHKEDSAKTQSLLNAPEPKPEEFTHYSKYLKALEDHKTVTSGPDNALLKGVNWSDAAANFSPEGKHRLSDDLGSPSVTEQGWALEAAVRLSAHHNFPVDWGRLQNELATAPDLSRWGGETAASKISNAQRRATQQRASNLMDNLNSSSFSASREDAEEVVNKIKQSGIHESARKKDYSGILSDHPDLLKQAEQLKTNADIVHVFTTPGIRDSFREIARSQPTPFAVAANDPQFNFINHSMKTWEDAKTALGPYDLDPLAHKVFNGAWQHHVKTQIATGQPVESAAALSNYLEREQANKGELTHFNKIDFDGLRQQYGHMPHFEEAVGALEQQQKQILGTMPDPFHVKKHMNQQGEQAMWNRLDNSSYVVKIKKHSGYDDYEDSENGKAKGEYVALAYHKDDLHRAVGHLSYAINGANESHVDSMHIDTPHRATTAAWQMINAAMDHVRHTTGRELGGTTSTTNMSAGLIRSMSGNTDSANPDALVKKYLGNSRTDVGVYGSDGMSENLDDSDKKLGCQTCGGSGVQHLDPGGLQSIAGKEHLSRGVARQIAHSLRGASMKCEDCKGSGIDPAQQSKDDEIPITELRHAPAGIKFGGTSPSIKMTPDEKIKHLGYDPEDPKGIRKLPGAE